MKLITVPFGGVDPTKVITFGFTGMVVVTDLEFPLKFVAVNVYDPVRFTSVGVPDKR